MTDLTAALAEEAKILIEALNAIGYHIIKIDLEQILNEFPEVKLWIRKDHKAREQAINQSPHSKRQQLL
jgi:hypothetical protein